MIVTNKQKAKDTDVIIIAQCDNKVKSKTKNKEIRTEFCRNQTILLTYSRVFTQNTSVKIT